MSSQIVKLIVKGFPGVHDGEYDLKQDNRLDGPLDSGKTQFLNAISIAITGGYKIDGTKFNFKDGDKNSMCKIYYSNGISQSYSNNKEGPTSLSSGKVLLNGMIPGFFLRGSTTNDKIKSLIGEGSIINKNINLEGKDYLINISNKQSTIKEFTKHNGYNKNKLLYINKNIFYHLNDSCYIGGLTNKVKEHIELNITNTSYIGNEMFLINSFLYTSVYHKLTALLKSAVNNKGDDYLVNLNNFKDTIEILSSMIGNNDKIEATENFINRILYQSNPNRIYNLKSKITKVICDIVLIAEEQLLRYKNKDISNASNIQRIRSLNRLFGLLSLDSIYNKEYKEFKTKTFISESKIDFNDEKVKSSLLLSVGFNTIQKIESFLLYKHSLIDKEYIYNNGIEKINKTHEYVLKNVNSTLGIYGGFIDTTGQLKIKVELEDGSYSLLSELSESKQLPYLINICYNINNNRGFSSSMLLIDDMKVNPDDTEYINKVFIEAADSQIIFTTTNLKSDSSLTLIN